eukprot:CAMPEP_0119562582 /NCGR_PEP_ID=MMETSP1352-20130426/20900_1 /TAXON_ID=265584 /ORGANISM="Stauroneis constricta, Strain CCMP1120" /LENGTH=172 /DNA_ID=CAMNT_0007611019 /DNA_START=145 /DNA_END=663 /DNA_ORIENTATION=-
MGRTCWECGDWKERYDFSGNQWRKGEGSSRCTDCVHGVTYQCHECYRTFNTQNQLNMHMQTHRPRNVSCPVCGETRFRSGANAVQHVESGFCSGCPGADNARQQIYDFASSKSHMRRYMTDVPQLEYGDYDYDNSVPDKPYYCPQCGSSFRQLSQLLQHQDNKHGNRMRLMG